MSTSHPEGFFALFKPSGLSSAGALRAVKGILSADKAGFLGTLDVPAMGVLPVAIGSATKLISFLPPSEKEYVGELVLGITTITDDMDGEVVERQGRRRASTMSAVRQGYRSRDSTDGAGSPARFSQAAGWRSRVQGNAWPGPPHRFCFGPGSSAAVQCASGAAER